MIADVRAVAFPIRRCTPPDIPSGKYGGRLARFTDALSTLNPGAGEVLHAFTYDNGGYGRAASVRCACGWRAFVPRSHKGRSVTLGRYAQFHLRHVGAKR